MPETIADFRSDTVTAPTSAMREAMARAEVGDDVLGEDPTVRRLERRGAELLGQEAALFVPSGTMANQVAIHVHCRPGDELLCEERCHVFVYEGGSAARLSGTQVRTLRAEDGFPEPDDVRAAARPNDVHHPRSRLLVLENTHNVAGGRVLDPTRLLALTATARALGMLVHVDGARLYNAAVAAGVEPADLCRGVDSVSLCLSKGLGAPVGSLLAGSGAFIDAARRARKAFGGGMRQAGVLAAAGLLALDDGAGLCARDHGRAQQLAAGLAGAAWLRVVPPETNIVMVDLPDGASGPEELIAWLRAQHVLCAQYGPRRVRFVTHRDVTDEHVERSIEAVQRFTPTSEGDRRR